MLSKLTKELRKLTTPEKVFLLFLIAAQIYYFYRYSFRFGSSFSPPGYINTPEILQIGKYVLAFVFFLVLGTLSLIKFKIAKVKEELSSQYFWILVALFIFYLSASLFKFGLDPKSFAITQYAKMLFVIPFIFFVPLIWRNKNFYPLVKLFLIFSLAYHLIYDILMIILYFLFDRQPGLSFSNVIGRYGGGWDDPNSFAAFLVLILTIFLSKQVVFGKKKSIYLHLLILLLTFALLFTYSITGFIGLTVSLFILFIFKSLSVRKLLVMPVAIILFALLNQFLRYTSIILGNKIASSKVHLSEPVSAPTEIPPAEGILEFVETFLGSFRQAVFNENLYLQIQRNFGLIGLILILLILALTIHRAFTGFKLSEKRSLERRFFYLIALSYLPAFAIMNLGLPFFQVFPINLFVWILIALVWTETIKGHKEVSLKQLFNGTKRLVK